MAGKLGPDNPETTRRKLVQAIALDTLRNEFQLHGRIHEWFAAGEVADVDALNERVYAELFLSPSDDPWMGLVPENTYTTLPGAGLIEG